jgi:hypothetical protein
MNALVNFLYSIFAIAFDTVGFFFGVVFGKYTWIVIVLIIGILSFWLYARVF